MSVGENPQGKKGGTEWAGNYLVPDKLQKWERLSLFGGKPEPQNERISENISLPAAALMLYHDPFPSFGL
jgi:hypothetical protein